MYCGNIVFCPARLTHRVNMQDNQTTKPFRMYLSAVSISVENQCDLTLLLTILPLVQSSRSNNKTETWFAVHFTSVPLSTILIVKYFLMIDIIWFLNFNNILILGALTLCIEEITNEIPWHISWFCLSLPYAMFLHFSHESVSHSHSKQIFHY